LFINRKVQSRSAWVSLRILGLLHMEIIQERLRREYNMDIIATSPSVYEVVTTRGDKMLIDNPRICPSEHDPGDSGADRGGIRAVPE
jgi:translation elongation factor EF-4